ncbi:uncharacterized protein LOC123560095 [Mercenaria mercenaria]|uniref:uncharacterized protein LOC123560095 n=1 Tax=Mercenaria mercenaria TaxID=6596 RepID=UPI00234EF2DF|nr:uncharacterized protein LOC123560095 [Mercenaria mercenaria]
MKSYGAAAYIVKGRQSSLVMAKNRVTPLKSITLPKLELMAAVVGARLDRHLQTPLNCKDVFMWSDSQIVLHWLQANRSKPLQRFVQNRINEIYELSGCFRWSYCPTQQNPTDLLLTRGITAKQHKENNLWWHGPTWITDKTQWPKRSLNLEHPTPALVTATDNQEILREQVSSSTGCETGIHKIIDIQRYSYYKKLLRVTAYVLSFVQRCRKPAVRVQRCHRSLGIDEIQSAERLWLQHCQQASYSIEINNLRTGTSRRLTLVRQLRLFLDADEILRCGGRIYNAPLSEMTKFPVLLPAKHPLTIVIVLDANREIQHSGVSATITLIRQRYWIPTIRQCVKSVIRRCVTCRKVQGKPFSAPDPPPLMKYRVHDSASFSVTEVDYTGALYVKNATGCESKAYICLFTCASTRAVHLEVVPDLTGDAFIQAFRRFVSRKSLPYLMVSDNATTFLSASTHLQQLSTMIQDELLSRGTIWEFIPERAPWFGGFWERLIGLTKSALKKVLGRSYITFEMLQTIVTEIEATLNDRPLTYVGSEFGLAEVITPAHLLYGRRVTTLPYHDITSSNLEMTSTTQIDIRKRAKVQQTIIDHFRDRWRNEYLTALREHHTTSGSNKQYISFGSVVQVHDGTPRSTWRLAVVEEVVKGKDGLIRSAKIRVGNKLSNRPITKLYPLEVN